MSPGRLYGPWLVIFRDVPISLAVFGTNLLGSALRDTLTHASAVREAAMRCSTRRGYAQTASDGIGFVPGYADCSRTGRRRSEALTRRGTSTASNHSAG